MTEAERRSTCHILFVDDQADQIRGYVARYPSGTTDGERIVREHCAYVFRYAASPLEAWDLLRFSRVDVDVVALDVRFPGHAEDGFWLLKNIMQMTTDLPVIVLTQTPDFQIAHTAGYYRGDRFLPKELFLNTDNPADLDLLLNEIDSVILSKRAQPEMHDRTHLVMSEAFADHYDMTEQSYPATIAYYLFENELITTTIESLRSSGSCVRICDVGCGTGRIEELIQRTGAWARDQIQVTAVDFSGRMLRLLDEKHIRSEVDELRLVRASAERMECLDRESFDFVIMGFGIPSYTKGHLSTAEAARVCRKGGVGLFSVYNERSAFYDANRQIAWSRDERPVAAVANPDTGRLEVGGDREFNAETFTEDRLVRLLSRNGWAVRSMVSFPTLYVTLPRSTVERMPDSGSAVAGFPLAQAFSPTLYDLDRRLSQAHPGFGHYLVGVAERI